MSLKHQRNGSKQVILRSSYPFIKNLKNCGHILLRSLVKLKCGFPGTTLILKEDKTALGCGFKQASTVLLSLLKKYGDQEFHFRKICVLWENVGASTHRRQACYQF